ncbi:MAG TPA: type VI secretion system ATPase TssH [Polyangia bacterium]|nr:type VI secretion system ATPase TssH [Polyangia bacterium]
MGADISVEAVAGKLNRVGYESFLQGLRQAKSAGNRNLELAHWLMHILQKDRTDLALTADHFKLDRAKMLADATAMVNGFRKNETEMPGISNQVADALDRGWHYATLLFGETQIRTGHLLVGILKSVELRRALIGVSQEFAKLPVDEVAAGQGAIWTGSDEGNLRPMDGSGVAAAGAEGAAAAPGAKGTTALDRFSQDLTAKAKGGQMDPVLGRDDEVRQVIDVLMRRRQNNPILTGEAGVGKTAVVEGFAQRVASGDVPPPLKGVKLCVLDVGLMQAGASMKGEFEQRLRSVIDEVQSSPTPIILFIDEAHTLVGAGGAAGTGDAANLLKPALARGKLRTIAATTWAEYKKHIEKDPALTRRFQVVQVPEPTEEKALLMMRGVASTLEAHHRVQILDEALEASVKLSHRYIPARQLPDKSVSLLDTACARVAISQHAVPAEVEDSRSRIVALDIELGILGRERAAGWETAEREVTANGKLEAEHKRLAELEARWKAEKGLVDEILAIRKTLRGSTEKVEGTASKLEAVAAKPDKEGQAGKVEKVAPPPVAAKTPALSEAERAPLLEKLKRLQGELSTLQGHTPLILPTVDNQAVAAVVGDWTGIPVGRMVKNEIETVLKLADTLGQRVIGQGHALEMIARRIQTSRAGLENPSKPIGVFMLAGPSGVGKTETALTLAESLYGGEQNLITINMSEFQEAHTVSTLKGAPPGYVGYGEGGVLTEAVRRRPYSVVLLDEVEKAHSDVHELFFQVFDKGFMEDGEGRLIDFKNTLIILTSNVGSELIINMCKDPELLPDPDGIAKALREPLLKSFPAALLGRMVTIPYYPLSDEMIGNIARLQLGRVTKRIAENHKVPFTFDDAVVKLIVSRCTEIESGGRMIDAILTNTLLPRISLEILTRLMKGDPVKKVAVTAPAAEFEYAFE